MDKIIKDCDRIGRLDQLIKLKATGNAERLSDLMGVSVSTINRLIKLMRELGCPIEYCRVRETYFYTKPGKMMIGFEECRISSKDLNILRGGVKNNFLKIVTMSDFDRVTI